MAKGLPKSIIKKYGITRKAWQVYRGKGKKRGGKTAKVKTTRRRARGFTAFGGKGLWSLKSLVAGALGMILMQRYNPYGGAYKPAIDKAAVGIVGPMLKLDNQDLLSAGVKEALATAVNSYLLGGFGGGGGGSYL